MLFQKRIVYTNFNIYVFIEWSNILHMVAQFLLLQIIYFNI
jgi:hypothetical protein